MRHNLLPLGIAAALVGLTAPSALHATDARSSTSSATEAATTHAKAKRVPNFTFRFPGRGFGHGVGMSQYGAYGMARAGRSAEQIITTYYRGTKISTLPSTSVRVLLEGGVTRARVSSTGKWTVGGDRGEQKALPKAAMTVRHAGGGRLLLESGGRKIAQYSDALVLRPQDDGTVTLGGVRYRGALRITPLGSRVRVINVIDLEKYLMGVVPREVPASWGDRAPAVLRAQAIAARSYAIATKKTGAFDMYADERSQVYGGASAEDPRTSDAVRDTAGKVATYKGKVATTFFFSTSGGSPRTPRTSSPTRFRIW